MINSWTLFRILQVTVGLDDRISFSRISDNPGLLPVRLGSAKLEQYAFTLLHFYDINPIILEINKLQIKSNNLTKIVDSNPEYKKDMINYFKILLLTQERVENKLKELIPHPQRTRRGLINAVGSVFKAITGNLDASDGERYEQLIQELQNNQKNVVSNIYKQNSISLNLIKKFNNTVEKISHNEKLLDSKIHQIGLIVQKATYRENSNFIKDILNQIINLYEIIDSVLQDLENAITFSKLKILHPSIIKTQDLYSELVKIQETLKGNSMPLEVSLGNTLLYEKIITIKSFTLNNRITFLIQIPIAYPNNFNYFHLYSLPTYKENLFKAILPKNKFLLENELHFSYLSDECQEILDQQYFCYKMDIQEKDAKSPCAVQLLETKGHSRTCQQIEIKISKPVFNQLTSSSEWIMVIPQEEIIGMKCTRQEEHVKLLGTYLVHIPTGCQISSSQQSITNYQQIVESKNELILFPDFEEQTSFLPTLNLTVQLNDVKLDDLHQLRDEIREIHPDAIFSEIYSSPNLWTMLLYGFLIFLVVYLICKKLQRWKTRKTANIKEDDPATTTPSRQIPEANVQLPCQAV